MCSHVRSLFPGKADQLERKLAWEAKHSWCEPSGQDPGFSNCHEDSVAADLFESSDVSTVDPPPDPKQPLIWSALCHPPVGE